MNQGSTASADLLDELAFTVDDLARACGVAPAWVQERVEIGVLQADRSTGQWRFDSATLVRARRIVQLETRFEADPQLAALTADLIEEVAMLRRRLRAIEG